MDFSTLKLKQKLYQLKKKVLHHDSHVAWGKVAAEVKAL